MSWVNDVYECLMYREHPRADGNWVATFIKEKLRRNPSYKANTAVDDIRAAYGVEVRYRTAWSGKEIARKEITGGDDNSFNRIRGFCNALKASNPGSVADVEVNPVNGKFLRTFIALGGCLLGFKEGCRPMFFIDAAHVKSKHRGSLMSVVAKDANGGFLTIAYACMFYN